MPSAPTNTTCTDARPSFGGPRRGKKLGGGNYTAPVGFVSAGIQQSGKKKEGAEEEEDPLEGSSSSAIRGKGDHRHEDSSGDDDDDDGGGHRGFGFGGRRRGLGGGGEKKAKVEADGPIAGMRKGEEELIF